MKERPLLISGPLIRPTRAGEKTQTRRLVKPQPVIVPGWSTKEPRIDGVRFAARAPREATYAADALDKYLDDIVRRFCPYGVVGDRLWVRERMRVVAVGDGRIRVVYEADGVESDWIDYPDRLARPVVGKCLAYGGPREASRIDLEVTAVRFERLREITDEDVRAEGVVVYPFMKGYHADGLCRTAAQESFRQLWSDINDERASWESNPWVWVVGFKLLRGGL